MKFTKPEGRPDPYGRTGPELEREAERFSDQFHPGEPGYGHPSDFFWSYDSNFALSSVGGCPNEWIAWAARERVAWIEGFGDERGPELSECWLSNPDLDPVIVVEGRDGRFYIWDGNHRIGVAFSAERVSVPAIVGRRKKRRKILRG